MRTFIGRATVPVTDIPLTSAINMGKMLEKENRK